MMQWVIIGACLIKGFCALPPAEAFDKFDDCERAREERLTEHPKGNAYRCVPAGQSDEERSAALLRLWRENGGRPE